MSIELTFLGTGHGNVSPERFQTSALLRAGESRCLIEAGEPCAQRLRSIGERPGDLDAVFLTHAHADHVGGLALLAQAAWGDGRDTPLPVLAPGSAIPALRQWLDFSLSLLPPRPGFGIDWVTWQEGIQRQEGEIAVSVRATTHLNAPHQAFALEVRAAGKRLIFSGDIGAASDLAPLLREPADLVVCEVAHVPPDALIAQFLNTDIGILALSHLAEHLAADTAALRAAFSDALPRAGLVVIAEDGQTLDM